VVADDVADETFSDAVKVELRLCGTMSDYESASWYLNGTRQDAEVSGRGFESTDTDGVRKGGVGE
jgi:hypothetical protein